MDESIKILKDPTFFEQTLAYIFFSADHTSNGFGTTAALSALCRIHSTVFQQCCIYNILYPSLLYRCNTNVCCIRAGSRGLFLAEGAAPPIPF